MNVGELKALIANVPDHYKVSWKDLQFPGPFADVKVEEMTFEPGEERLYFTPPWQDPIEW